MLPLCHSTRTGGPNGQLKRRKTSDQSSSLLWILKVQISFRLHQYAPNTPREKGTINALLEEITTWKYLESGLRRRTRTREFSAGQELYNTWTNFAPPAHKCASSPAPREHGFHFCLLSFLLFRVVLERRNGPLPR